MMNEALDTLQRLNDVAFEAITTLADSDTPCEKARSLETDVAMMDK